MEVAVSVKTKTDNTEGYPRIQEGDIVEIRELRGGIGTEESKEFLWLLVEGLDSDEMGQWKEPWESFDSGFDREHPMQYKLKRNVSKRRYCIPLDRLPSWIDPSRVRDTDDEYQPFHVLSPNNYKWDEGASHEPLWVEGLVFDRSRQRFL